MTNEGLAKVVPISILIGVVLGSLCLFLTGCSMLGLSGDEASVAAVEAPVEPPSLVEGVIGAVSAANPSVGAIAAGLFGAYQLVRKRSRKRWANAAKATLTGRLNEAVREVDAALGGGHSSKAGAKADAS